MTKFQKCFDDMINNNQELFNDFSKIHSLYIKDPNAYQRQFNEIGFKIQDVIRSYENTLCNHSQNSGYGKYSINLSEKFHNLIRKKFTKIDSIGME